MSSLVVRRMRGKALPSVWPIHEEAFPPEERKSAEALRGMLLDESYCFLGAFAGAEGEAFFGCASPEGLLGFAAVRRLEGTDAALLEYLAVHAGARGMGVGSMLLRSVLEQAAAESRVLLIEVESALGAGHQAEARHRRRAWYRRMGVRELAGLCWQMPPVGGGPPPPMVLMLAGLEEAVLERDRVRRWVRAIYGQVYGRAEGEADGMVEGLGAMVEVV